MPARVSLEMTANMSKVFEAFNRLIEKQEKMIDGFNKAQNASERSSRKIRQNLRDNDKAAKKFGQNFGPEALSQLKNYATGVIGITTAVNALKSAWDGVDQARESALATLEESQMGMESLVQLADTPEKLQKLQRAAINIYRTGAAGSLSEAAATVFQLESAGAMGAIGLFRDIYGAVADPAKLAKAAATIQTAMGGAETGTYRDIVSKGLAASAYSPATVEDLLEAAARGGAFAKAIGVSDEALLASTALLAKGASSAELGGTQAKAFFKVLDRARQQTGEDFRGLGLEGVMRKLGGMTEEQRSEVLGGRAEATVAYRTIRDNFSLVKEIMASQVQGINQDLAGRKIALARQDPFFAQMRSTRAAQASLEIARMPAGLERAQSEAIINRAEADYLEQGGSEWAAWFGSKTMRIQRWLPYVGRSGDQEIAQIYGSEFELADMNRATRQFRENVIQPNHTIELVNRALESGPTLSKPDRDR